VNPIPEASITVALFSLTMAGTPPQALVNMFLKMLDVALPEVEGQLGNP
jgi:hypothetical protein